MNGKLGAWDKILDVLSRIGAPASVLGGGLYAAAYGYGFVLDVLDPNKVGDRGDFAQMCFGLMCGVVGAGLSRGLKRSTELYVASEAEKRIANPSLESESSIPVIQKEIAKQKVGASQIATLPNKE